MKKIMIICLCILVSVLILLTVNVVSIAQLNSIGQQASKIREPFYTLVVDNEIVHHSYPVRLDRFTFDDADKVGYEDGRVEVPLLTVFTAMGAKCENAENGMVNITYRGKEYVLVPERQALLDKKTLENALNADSDEWIGYNYLLIWPEQEGAYFREDHGEYIVDIGSLHKLCVTLDFTFEVDQERGIVFFFSEPASPMCGVEPPSH